MFNYQRRVSCANVCLFAFLGVGHLIDVRLRFMASENSKPRKQARLDTFLIPRRDEKSQR